MGHIRTDGNGAAEIEKLIRLEKIGNRSRKFLKKREYDKRNNSKHFLKGREGLERSE